MIASEEFTAINKKLIDNLETTQILQASNFMKSKVNVDRDTKLSKKLSYLLRHGALKEKIDIAADGFANVDKLLREKLSGYSLDDVKRIVANDDKQRFALREKNGSLELRANQGHSIKEIGELFLKPLENLDFEIIHGTYLEHWPRIKDQGLSRMKRNHIHFSKGLNFRCGLRANASLLIYVDFEKAKGANLKFYESDNGVILCSGNEQGFLERRYFSRVVTRQGKILLPES